MAHGVRAALTTALGSTSRSNAEDAEEGEAGVSLAEGGVASSPSLGEKAEDTPEIPLPAPPAPEEDPPRELSAEPIEDPNHEMVDDEDTEAGVAAVAAVLEASRKALDASATFAASCRALARWAPPPGKECGRRAIGMDTVLNSSSDAGGAWCLCSAAVAACGAAAGGGGSGGAGFPKALLLMLRRNSLADARSKDDDGFCSRLAVSRAPPPTSPLLPPARPPSSRLLSLLAGDLSRPLALGLPHAESARGELAPGSSSPGLSSPGGRFLLRSRLVARR